MFRSFVPAKVAIPRGESLPAFLQPLVELAGKGDDLKPAVRVIVDEMGFADMFYGGNTIPVPRPQSDCGIYVFSTAKPEWIERYSAADYVLVDPRLARTWTSTLPYLWDQGTERGHAPAVDRFLDDALAHGIGSGIALSFFTALGTRVFFALNQPDPVLTDRRRSAIAAGIGDIYLFATTFHRLFLQGVVECSSSPPQEGAPVSEMEGITLRMLHRGIPVAMIADRMAISPEQVQRCIENACAKLGVRTQDRAVEQAFERGLIRP